MAARLFISYAREDAVYALQLSKHLAALKNEGLIEVWSDHELQPGDRFDQVIADELRRADVILVLISANFLASSYAYPVELKHALERHERGDVRLVPIIVRDCDWQTSPIGVLQVLPRNAQPVSNWPDPDNAYTDIVRGLRRLVAARRMGPSPPPNESSPPRGHERTDPDVPHGTSDDARPGRAATTGPQPSPEPWPRAPGPAPPSAVATVRPIRSRLRAIFLGLLAGALVIVGGLLWLRTRLETGPAAPTATASGQQAPSGSTEPPPVRGPADTPTMRDTRTLPSAAQTTTAALSETESLARIDTPDGVLVIAEVRITRRDGSPWDRGNSGRWQLPDLYVCLRRKSGGGEVCVPTLGGIPNARIIADDNASHLVGAYGYITSWSGGYSVALMDQGWASPTVLARGDCVFGQPCRLSAGGDTSPVAELLLLPALNSNADLQARYLRPCVAADSLLLQQVQALYAAVKLPSPAAGSLSVDALARILVAVRGVELGESAREAVFAAGSQGLNGLTPAQNFRGSVLQRVATLVESGDRGFDGAETTRILNFLRNSLQATELGAVIAQGCGKAASG